MKTVGENYKTKAKSDSRVELVKLIDKDTNDVIDGEYIIDGFLQEISFADNTLFGNTPSKNLEINLYNPDSIEYTGKELEVYTGILIDGEPEYIKQGTFIVDSAEEQVVKDTTRLTALDYMIKFNKIFVDELDWETTRTLREFAEYVCAKCGVSLSSNSFPNDDYILTEQPAFEGYTCRYVLGKIAEISGSIAIINENDEAEIKPITLSDEYEDISVNSILSMDVSETTYLPYNSVMISLAEGIEGENVTLRDEESIATYGENCLKIVGNEFAINESVRKDLIEAIFSSVNGFFYIPLSITYNSYDWLSRMDKIRVYYDYEKYHETYLLNHTIEFPNSIKSTIENDSKTSINSEYEYVPVADQKQSHTEIVVDKLNKKITSTVSEVTSQGEQISQLTQDLSSVNLNITNIEKGISSLETDLESANANISSLEDDIDALSYDLNGISQDFTDFKDNEYINSIDNLQKQIDGAIQFWNGSEVPTLDNYPANEWTTEADRNNHRADIYTVIQDVDGELKQGKSYRFELVDGVWQWIELTDNELSAVQEIAQNALKQANTNASDIITLKQTDTEIKADIEGIELNYDTLNNQFDSTVTTRKTIEGNPIYIEDAGAYDLEEMYLEGNNYQEVTEQSDNLLDLTKIDLTCDSTLFNLEIIDSNTLSISNIADLTAWKTSITLDLNDIVENGYAYSFGAKATEDSEQNTAGGYGTLSFGQYTKGTTTRNLYKDVAIANTTTNYLQTPSIVVDKDSYDYKLIYFMSQGSALSDNITISLERMGIYKNKCITNITMESGNLNYETGANEDSDSRIRCSDYIDIEGYSKVTLIPSPTYSSSTTIGIRWYDKDKTLIANPNSSFMTHVDLTPSNALDTTKTPKYLRFTLVSTDLSVVQNLALIPSRTYTPFVPDSPSPDYPSDIEVIEGSVDVKVTGKNLLPISNLQTNTKNGITFTNNGDGTYTWSGTSTAITGNQLFSNVNTSILLDLDFEEGEYYTLSIKLINGSNAHFALPLAIIDDDGNITYNYLTLSSPTKKIEKKCKLYNLSTYFVANVTVNCTLSIQLEKSSSATEYDTYKGETYSLDLQGNFLAKIGDVHDEVDVVTGKLTKRIGKLILDGSETWNRTTTNNSNYYFYSQPSINAYKVYSNKDAGLYEMSNIGISSNTYQESEGVYIFYYNTRHQINLFSETTKQYTQTEFKSWLASNNVVIYYVLEESYEVQLTPTQIAMNEGINNIFVTTNLDPSYISTTYLTDSVLNGQYATKTQLQLTNDKITSVVQNTTTLNANLTDLQALVSVENTDLKNALSDLTNNVEENYATNESVLTVTNSVSNIQTSLNQQIEITKDIQLNGVSKVTTTTGFTFDENGLTVSKTNADTKTTIDEDGMTVYSTTGSENTEMLVVDSKGVQAENVTVRTYLIVGQNSRFQDYETGTGCFYIGK